MKINLLPDYHDTIGDYKGFPQRNPYRQHEKSCYDDDYCSYKCCYKDHHHEDVYDWEHEYKGHRQHHDEDQEDDWAQQDERRVPNRWWDEDDSPSSRPDGTVNPPEFDEGTKDLSEKPTHPPDDEDRSRDDDDDSQDDQDDSKDDEDDSKDDEDDSKDNKEESQNDEDKSSRDEDGPQGDENTEYEL